MIFTMKNAVRMKKTLCFKPIKVNLSEYENIEAAIADVRATLEGTDVPNDGVFIEVNSQLGYAWIYDPDSARLMGGDEIM